MIGQTQVRTSPWSGEPRTIVNERSESDATTIARGITGSVTTRLYLPSILLFGLTALLPEGRRFWDSGCHKLRRACGLIAVIIPTGTVQPVLRSVRMQVPSRVPVPIEDQITDVTPEDPV